MSAFAAYESVDYTYVINRVLLRIAEARAAIDVSMRHNFKKSLYEYFRAVEALLVVLLPHLRPSKSREKIMEAREKIHIEDPGVIDILDQIVEDTLVALNRNRLLLRGEVIRVTR